MKTYNEFITEAEELNENIQFANADVMKVKTALETGLMGKMKPGSKLVYTTSKNESVGDGIAMNTGDRYFEWNSETGTAKIKQTRAAGLHGMELCKLPENGSQCLAR